jgi:proline-specific peptidase
MESMSALAETGRRVVFYDQLGCGRSATPPNPDLWTIPLYREEVDVVRQALGLQRLHILGQSWGGMLGMEYALTQPDGLASLIVADSPASIPQWVAEANRLREDLPEDVQATLLKHEQNGTTDLPEYEAAVEVFYRRHVCRLDPWPDYVARAFDNMAKNPEVYHVMNGPSEFHVVGLLKEWDITGRLAEIHVPTLIVSGRYDEATPAIAQTVHDGIPGSEWVLFEESSHMPHAEEPERFVEVVDAFMTRVEDGQVGH